MTTLERSLDKQFTNSLVEGLVCKRLGSAHFKTTLRVASIPCIRLQGCKNVTWNKPIIRDQHFKVTRRISVRELKSSWETNDPHLIELHSTSTITVEQGQVEQGGASPCGFYDLKAHKHTTSRPTHGSLEKHSRSLKQLHSVYCSRKSHVL